MDIKKYILKFRVNFKNYHIFIVGSRFQDPIRIPCWIITAYAFCAVGSRSARCEKDGEYTNTVASPVIVCIIRG